MKQIEKGASTVGSFRLIKSPAQFSSRNRLNKEKSQKKRKKSLCQGYVSFEDALDALKWIDKSVF